MAGGEAGDSPLFKLSLDLGPDVKLRAVLAEKGYDAKANRALARARGIAPAIPFKSNAKGPRAFFRKALYRAAPASTFGKLKRFKRVALRCEYRPRLRRRRHAEEGQSVGGAPQYVSMVGKRANCQALVSVTLTRNEVHVVARFDHFEGRSWRGLHRHVLMTMIA